MSVSRREFLKLTLKGAVLIGISNSLQSFTGNGFVLPSKNKVQLRFAIASDGHYGQTNTEYEKYHDEMVSWINTEKKGRGVDFTMINGDLFHNEIEFLPQVKSKWDQLTMPYYVSHGNHDETEEAHWEQTWNMPWHYTFEKKEAAFLVLNSADTKGNYVCPNLSWCNEQLIKYQHKKQLFVFMHITPFNWTKGGLPCPDLVKLFDNQVNLKAVFHGHDHDMDAVKENNGKYYFFDSHIAGNWGTEYRGYRIVEVLKNGETLTYQMNPTTLLRQNENTIT